MGSWEARGHSYQLGRPIPCWPALFLVYALARLTEFAGAGALFTEDSHDYERIAASPILSARFFSEYKPWLVPLVYKLVPGGAAAELCTQLAISIVCWFALAVCARRAVRSRVGWVAVVGVLGLSATLPVAQWDAAVLSESLSLSLGALLVAALLEFVRRPSWRGAAFAALAGLLWAGARDTNAYVLVGLAVPTATLVAFSGRRTLGAGLVLAACATFALSSCSAGNPRRFELLVIDLVNERVLADPEATTYFVAHGMPLRADLRRRLFVDRAPLARYEHDPELAAFRRWLHARGRATYVAYLRSHPGASLGEPLERLAQLDSPEGLRYYTPSGFRSTPAWLESILYPAAGSSVLAWSAIALLVCVLLALRRRWRRELAVPILLVLVTAPQAVLVWDAEPREVARHALLVGVLNRLGLLLLVCLLADRGLRQLARRRATARLALEAAG